MIKILYAANNNLNSKIQLSRFIDNISGVELKIAAYKNYSPNINIDYTLDCLYGFNNERNIDNSYLKIYYDKINKYSPDLIISDLEFFTSKIARELNIPLWQCSSNLLDYAIDFHHKYDLGISGKYKKILEKTSLDHNFDTVLSSDKNLVYSHLCDNFIKPELKKEFNWVRPYFVIGEESITCKKNVVAATIGYNKNIISLLSKYNDSVLFHDNNYFINNILCKSLSNEEEFACNLYNSNFFVCQGESSFLSDAFYNYKYSIIIPNLFDNNCIINSLVCKKYQTSDNIYNVGDSFEIKDIKINFNSNCKFLHELI